MRISGIWFIHVYQLQLHADIWIPYSYIWSWYNIETLRHWHFVERLHWGKYAFMPSNVSSIVHIQLLVRHTKSFSKLSIAWISGRFIDGENRSTRWKPATCRKRMCDIFLCFALQKKCRHLFAEHDVVFYYNVLHYNSCIISKTKVKHVYIYTLSLISLIFWQSLKTINQGKDEWARNSLTYIDPQSNILAKFDDILICISIIPTVTKIQIIKTYRIIM